MNTLRQKEPIAPQDQEPTMKALYREVFSRGCVYKMKDFITLLKAHGVDEVRFQIASTPCAWKWQTKRRARLYPVRHGRELVTDNLFSRSLVRSSVWVVNSNGNVRAADRVWSESVCHILRCECDLINTLLKGNQP